MPQPALTPLHSCRVAVPMLHRRWCTFRTVSLTRVALAHSQDLDAARAADKYPPDYNQSMNQVVNQEVVRYNRLLREIRSSLHELQRAIDGVVVMTRELDDVFKSFVVGAVPAAWLAKSYPSLKPLGSYFDLLLMRIHEFQRWIDTHPPAIYWLSGFFFTHSFLTAIRRAALRWPGVPTCCGTAHTRRTTHRPAALPSRPQAELRAQAPHPDRHGRVRVRDAGHVGAAPGGPHPAPGGRRPGARDVPGRGRVGPGERHAGRGAAAGAVHPCAHGAAAPYARVRAERNWCLRVSPVPDHREARAADDDGPLD